MQGKAKEQNFGKIKTIYLHIQDGHELEFYNIFFEEIMAFSSSLPKFVFQKICSRSPLQTICEQKGGKYINCLNS